MPSMGLCCCGTMTEGLWHTFRYYIGTLAYGALVVAFTRLLRIPCILIRALMGGKSEERQLDEPESLGHSICQLLMLVVNFIEHAVGCYSKNVWAGVVLSGYDFCHAANETKILLEEA